MSGRGPVCINEQALMQDRNVCHVIPSQSMKS